ncbi:MAG TPA: hypothetical protein VFA46_02710 [Actinomycetes bacterium]|nr:hypothetical protein [Actinomycetes bacterium]
MSLTTERTIRHCRLACRRCQRTWQRTYEVIAYHDAAGDHELFYRNGVAVPPPWARPTCPYCGGLRVALLPTGAPISGTATTA